MQKYGKTLNHNRFFPNFYTFATNLTPEMRYFKVIFTVSCHDDSKYDRSIMLQTAKDVLCSMAGDVGFEAFEDCGGSITGYVQAHLLDRKKIDLCIAHFPISNVCITYNIDNVENKDWNSEWEQQGFEPIYIEEKCVIHDIKHSAIIRHEPNVLDITIDAEQAFGTGTHDTTRMIVTYLINMELQNKNILDCGCGTGILSIIASKTGARSVTAYDIDDWSIRNTQHNCTINNVNNVQTMLGDASVLNDIAENFDVVIANINRNIILADLSSFRKRMADDAILILSGFYLQDAKMLIEKATSLNLTLEKTQSSNNWCMLVFKTAHL